MRSRAVPGPRAEPGALVLVRLLLGAVLLASAVACDSDSADTVEPSSDDATSDDATDAPEPDSGPTDAFAEGDATDVTVTRFELVAHPWNPLARFVEWNTDRPAPVTIGVECDGDDPTIRWQGNGVDTGAIFIFGFYDGANCEAWLSVGEAAPAASMTFAVDAALDLPTIEVSRSEVGEPQAGWTLVGLNNQFDGEQMILALIDHDGRYRWFHRVNGPPGSDNEITIRPEGVLVGGTREEIDPHIVAWDGTELWRRDIYMHHDIRYLGDRIVYLVHDDVCDWSRKGAGVVEYSLEQDEVVWEYYLCEDIQPEDPAFDWAHINTVEPLDDGGYLISPRNLNTIYRLDRELGTLDWGLGQMGDFEMSDDAVFWRQHAPEIQPNGNILLFDNGLAPHRRWSRAVEYALDFDTMTAEVAWEYAPDPPLYAPIMGDADRLANGNTLVTFGQRSETAITRLIEVDAEAREVWELRPQQRWGFYRADRVDVPGLAVALE